MSVHSQVPIVVLSDDEENTEDPILPRNPPPTARTRSGADAPRSSQNFSISNTPKLDRTAFETPPQASLPGSWDQPATESGGLVEEVEDSEEDPPFQHSNDDQSLHATASPSAQAAAVPHTPPPFNETAASYNSETGASQSSPTRLESLFSRPKKQKVAPQSIEEAFEAAFIDDQEPDMMEIDEHGDIVVISDDESRTIVPNSPKVHEASENYDVSQEAEPPAVVEEDSDDDIAVLSKEEAERVGTFKKTTFEDSPPSPSPPAYNQPAPVFHAGSINAPMSSEDTVIRDYFLKYSVPQLFQHESNLGTQLQVLERNRDEFLRQVTEFRNRISMLSFEQVSLRGELMRAISEKLRYAEEAIKRARKVRKYQGILDSVKNFRLFPQHTMQNYNQAVVVENEPTLSSNVNPYYQSERSHEDHADLENLLKDIYKEEDVEGMESTPDSMSIQLLDHQRQGLYWLLKRERAEKGCILADDMGLGKTVQTIALMMANPPEDRKCKTTLIVGPVSLLRQWDAELRAKVKPSSAVKVSFFHGQSRRKLSSFRHISKYDVVLTSYTTLASEFKQHYAQAIEEAQVGRNQNVLPDLGAGGQRYCSPFFSSDSNFYRIVLDEAQYIKNKLSLTSKAVACLKGTHRMCLTGTPMQNNIDELYPILRFLRARPYNDESKFKTEIAVPLKSGGDSTFDDYDRNQSMKKLRAVLSAVMLRRTKTSKIDGKPLLQLPEKTITQVFVKMESDEQSFYTDLEKGIQKKARRLLESSSTTHHSNFLTLLLRLRQACIHQILVQTGELNSHERSGKEGVENWQQKYERLISMSHTARDTVADILRQSEPMRTAQDSKVLNLKDEPEFVENSKDVVLSSESDEIQFTCPMCFDVVSPDSIVVMTTCGHMVCDGCVENLFNQNELGDSKMATRPGTCAVCNEPTGRNDLVAFDMFTKVNYKGYSFQKFGEEYGNLRVAKSTNAEKIAKLIKESDGFMPSAKMEKTVSIIQSVVNDTPDEKVIVFSHFTGTFDLMGYALKQEKIKFLRYDGTMSIDTKNEVISEFYKSDKRVLLISLKAGNVGLTLTCASHVIIMDPFWNPFVEDQAMDRAHRFGQQRPVTVYRLLIKNSVEDRITELQQRKKELISAAMDESALKSSSSLGRKELGYLFGLNGL